MSDTDKMFEAVDGRIRQQGYAAIKVKDGEMFFFTTDTLEKLLAKSKENPDGRVAVFIPIQH
jgi:hypothetical protein